MGRHRRRSSVMRPSSAAKLGSFWWSSPTSVCPVFAECFAEGQIPSQRRWMAFSFWLGRAARRRARFFLQSFSRAPRDIGRCIVQISIPKPCFWMSCFAIWISTFDRFFRGCLFESVDEFFRKIHSRTQDFSLSYIERLIPG